MSHEDLYVLGSDWSHLSDLRPSDNVVIYMHACLGEPNGRFNVARAHEAVNMLADANGTKKKRKRVQPGTEGDEGVTVKKPSKPPPVPPKVPPKVPRVRGKEKEKTPQRAPLGIQGLTNFGNTCFLASCVQAINIVPVLRNCFINHVVGNLAGDPDQIEFFSELSRLLNNMSVTSTLEATLVVIRYNHWALSNWPRGEQACAYQCLGQIFERLSELSPTSTSTLQSQVVYLTNCDRQTAMWQSAPETFLIFPLALPAYDPYENAATGLSTLFQSATSGQDMECHCDMPHHRMNRRLRFLANALPSVFVLALNRFRTQLQPSFSVTKNTIRIHLTERIVYIPDISVSDLGVETLKPFGRMDSLNNTDEVPVNGHVYDLMVVIYHTSRTPIIEARSYSGHYFAIGRGTDGVYRKYDDSLVTPLGTDFELAFNNGPRPEDTAFLLLFSKRVNPPSATNPRKVTGPCSICNQGDITDRCLVCGVFLHGFCGRPNVPDDDSSPAVCKKH